MNTNSIRTLTLGLMLSASLAASAQIRPEAYLANAHSHNDYTRNNPFTQAYSLGFGSIEVDLYLKDGELYVAHEPQEITLDGRTYADMLENYTIEDGSVQLDAYAVKVLKTERNK